MVVRRLKTRLFQESDENVNSILEQVTNPILEQVTNPIQQQSFTDLILELNDIFMSINEFTPERENFVSSSLNTYNFSTLTFLPQSFAGFNTGLNIDAFLFVLENDLINNNLPENGLLLCECLYGLFDNFTTSMQFNKQVFDYTSAYFPEELLNWKNEWGNNLLMKALTNPFDEELSIFNASMYINFLTFIVLERNLNSLPSFIVCKQNYNGITFGSCPTQQLLLSLQPQLLNIYLSLPGKKEELSIYADYNRYFNVETETNHVIYEPLIQYSLSTNEFQLLSIEQLELLKHCFEILIQHEYDKTMNTKSTNLIDSDRTIKEYLEQYDWNTLCIKQVLL